MNNFNELNLPEALLRALEKMKFDTPTPIQAQAIPVALEGRDILGSAQTGTGKTGAFGIPLVAHLLKNEKSMAIVMTPTRELAVQVMQTIQKLIGHNSPIKTALLIGGENMFKQFGQLQNDPRIIVGTPGRINDHLSRRSLKLNNADFLVLDETDRMLDMGFGVQIDKILAYMPQKRQTLMFSATLPPAIVKMSGKYMNNAERIAVGSTNTPIQAIKQELIHVPQPEKYVALTEQLDKRGGSIIVFVRTKHGADRLARKLEREKHSAAAIHGDLRQNQRDKVIRKFRDKSYRILVATDVAARGLDIPHIEHVINYDLPQCPEDYIHRIGRTARAGASGEALCLIAPEEKGKWNAIDRLINGVTDENREEGGQRRSNNNRRRNKGRNRHREGGQRNYGPREGGFNDRKRKQHRKGRPPSNHGSNHGERTGNVQVVAEPREDRPWRNDRPNRDDRQERSNNRPQESRQRDDRKRDDRPRHQEQRHDRKRDDRPRNDGQRNDDQRKDRPRNDRFNGGGNQPPRRKKNRNFQGKPQFNRDAA